MRKIADGNVTCFQNSKKISENEKNEIRDSDQNSGYGSILNEIMSYSRGSFGTSNSKNSKGKKKSLLKKVKVRKGKVIKFFKKEDEESIDIIKNVKNEEEKKSQFYVEKSKKKVHIIEEDISSVFSGDSQVKILGKTSQLKEGLKDIIIDEEGTNEENTNSKSKNEDLSEKKIEGGSLKGFEELEEGSLGKFESELLDDVDVDFEFDDEDEFSGFGRLGLVRHQSAA